MTLARGNVADSGRGIVIRITVASTILSDSQRSLNPGRSPTVAMRGRAAAG